MPDGVFPAFGRSATYRTGAFQSLSQVALMKILPSYIHPAQVRCALTAVFVNMYDGNQNFDKTAGWYWDLMVINLNWLIIILLPVVCIWQHLVF